MKLLHFEKLQPLCPRCQRDLNQETPLKINTVLRQEKDVILEGILTCTQKQCLSEYPIIDGIPVILVDLRAYISQNIFPILARTDLTDTLESLVGDCCGPNSPFDAMRQHLSTYTSDHYGDLDSEEDAEPSLLKLVKEGLTAVGESVSGPVIDLGCSVGRASFALAEARDDIVLGIDLNFNMLRTASCVLHHGLVRYPRRRVGMVYDTREFSVAFEGGDRVDFWACDAMNPPFAGKSFSLATSFNLLDCLRSPYDHLLSLSRILKPEGKAIITTPYDWSPNATPVESWFGGHSQRSETQGASEAILRKFLAGGDHPQSIDNLKLVYENEAIPWSVRSHDRSVTNYQVHMAVVQAKADGGPASK